MTTVEDRTDGQWSVSGARGGDGEFLVVGGEGQAFGLVAAVTLEGDARLIAAARDFAAAAEQMIAHEQSGGDGWWNGFEMLKAAYTRATGAKPKEPK